MRFFLAIACVIVVVLSACSLNSAQCECPNMSPTVTFTITDATTGNAIENPVFSVDASSVTGGCIGVFADDAGPDAGPLCKQWQLSLPVGHSTVTVGAAGYQTQTFGLDTTMGTGCCATGTQLQKQVALSP